MMRQMRENTKWIMIISSLAFVGLMVFSWGMDITGRSTGSLGEIGRVNGTAVQYNDYMNVYRMLYTQQSPAQTEPISAQQNRDLEQRAWDQMVDRILIQKELESRGIEVTDEEVRQAARFQPPPEIRDNPMFLTEGNFDLVKYQNYLSNSADPTLFAQLEAYYRDILPQGKLMRQVATGIFVTDGELWQRYQDQHETAWVRFVALNPAQRVPDDAVPVTDAEVETYWKDHQDDFQVPNRATVKVVSISKIPTPADTAAARQRVASLVAELSAGQNIDSLGKREAEADQPATFQDLGTFGRGQMMGAFDTAAFEAPIGRAVGPVETSFGFHTLVVSKRTADSATAKHILVPVVRTIESEDALLLLADSMEALAEGRTLDEVGRVLGLTVSTTELNDAFPFLAGAGPAGDGSDWAFLDAQPGDVSDAYENDQSFYAIELVSKKPAGVLPLEEATPTIQTVLRLEKKLVKGTEEGRQLVERIKGGASFTDAAAAMGLEVRTPGPFTRTEFVPLLGQQNAAVGAAFGLSTGTLSDPVATQDDVYVMEKLGQTPADSTLWLAEKDEQRRALLSLLQQQRMEEWIAGLRAAANIIDRRAEVLKPLSDTTAVPMGPPLGF